MLQNIQLQLFPLAIQHCFQMAGSSAQQQQSGREPWMQEHFGIGATNHVPGATEHVPIVEVAFANGKWWSIPQEMSSQLYEKYVQDQDAVYTWDWGEGGRIGSWTPDGEETNINRLRSFFSTAFKRIWTTNANAPFESYGYALKMWKHASQVNCHHRHDQWCSPC